MPTDDETLWHRKLVQKANLKGLRDARQWGGIFDPDGIG